MKKLSEIVPSLLTQSSQDSTKRPDSNRPVIVWSQLAQLYGNSLFREHGEEPNQLWIEAIDRLSDEEIKRGLANLAEQALAFPANCGQFVHACKTIPESRPWLNQPKQIEDQRPKGRMSRADFIAQEEGS